VRAVPDDILPVAEKPIDRGPADLQAPKPSAVKRQHELALVEIL
jgi:hypothetical protein